MGNNNIENTIEFLKNQYNRSKYYRDNKEEKDYRLEHSLRVMNIGIEIAQNEDMDVESLALGCILHDISYMNGFNSEEDWLDHGRNSAIIARPYLESLELEEEKINEICYGIAIHVDDKAHCEGEKTLLALSIADCDNIDRFDAYKIYDNLQNIKFNEMVFDEKREYINKKLESFKKYIDMELSTKTATKLWKDKIGFQIEFFRRLENQIDKSSTCSVL
ncbi:MAG: HD domain-containing protein [Clostridium sp.]